MPNIREMQRRLSQWATDHPQERYRDLFNLVCQPAWLRQAYENVARNKGAKTPGIDGMTHRTWERHIEDNLERLRCELREGRYQPQPCRRVYIPKKDGKLRPLGIPTFRDRTVQEAVRMAIEPIFEADFFHTSHGFRPNRSTRDAMRAVKVYMLNKKRMYYVIEGDIKGCFDAIHHKKLMSLLKRRIADKRILSIIWLFLKSGVMEDGLFRSTGHGTPQGGVISPLLANVYLHELDRFYYDRFTNRTHWEREKCRKHGGNNAGYVRYADDFVFLCNGHIEDVRKLKEEVASYLSRELHLTLSEEKTVITYVNDGFEFLGFRFYRGRGQDGKWKPKAAIPKSRMESVKENIRRLTERDRTFMDEAAVVARLNAVLRGWGNYYQDMFASTDFRKVDHYACHRLVRWYRHKYHWKSTEVLKRRYTRDAGNRRLFAEWDSSKGRKRITLVVLTRDIKRFSYYPWQKVNPYLAED